MSWQQAEAGRTRYANRTSNLQSKFMFLQGNSSQLRFVRPKGNALAFLGEAELARGGRFVSIVCVVRGAQKLQNPKWNREREFER